MYVGVACVQGELPIRSLSTGKRQALIELAVMGFGEHKRVALGKRSLPAHLHVGPPSTLCHGPSTGQSTTLSPGWRRGIGLSHTAVLMTCFQRVW